LKLPSIFSVELHQSFEGVEFSGLGILKASKILNFAEVNFGVFEGSQFSDYVLKRFLIIPF